MVQWLGLHAFNAGGSGSTLGLGTRLPRAAQHGQKKESVGKVREKRLKLVLS